MKQGESIKENPAFICDFMLGRLSKWMRLLGLDTAYFRDTNDKTIIYYSKKGGRTILTRSKILSEKYDDLILIESENLIEQLKQITNIAKINLPFSRCPICNIQTEKVDKEEIKNAVPPYVFEIHNDFKRCPECGRVFWKGTHYKEIKKVINEIKN